MKKILLSLFAVAMISAAQSQVLLYQGFDDVSGMSGWTIENHSNPVGATSWQQGDPELFGSASVAGPENSFANALYTSTGDNGTISDWMVSPTVNISNGDSVRFYALSFNSTAYPDRLEIRLSTDGDASTMPSDETGVGSFTTLLYSINPDLDNTTFPSVVNGDLWTWYSIPVTGVGSDVPSRVAFRYFVTGAGAAGVNSTQVGVDEFYVVGPEGFDSVEEVASVATVRVYPNPASNDITVQVSQKITGQLSILDMSGRVVKSLNTTSSLDRFNMNVSDLADGVYTLQVTEKSGQVYNQRFVKK